MPEDPFVVKARKKNEWGLKDDVAEYLEKLRPRVWFLKVHGNAYQRAGVLDYLLCIHGHFVAIELKHPSRKTALRAGQVREKAWLVQAGAAVAVCRTLEEVQGVVEWYRKQPSMKLSSMGIDE